MDLNDPNFFRLNYLCLNGIGSLGSQSVIIEKSITQSNINKNARLGNTSLTKKGSVPKYNKIDNTKISLKERYSNNKKQNLAKTKSNNRKVINNIYQTYYTENNRIKPVIEYPIALSPTTTEKENNQKNCYLNLYNEIASENNNIRYSRIGTESNYKHQNQNISSENIINNTFIPLTETKYHYLNNNNTYFHTNFVFKINNGSNSKNKIYRGSSYRQTPNKKRSKNFKKFFGINTNNYNNYYNNIYNNSNYNIIDNNNKINNTNNIDNKNSINIKKNNENENNSEIKNKNDIYKISYKLDNNSCLIDHNS